MQYKQFNPMKKQEPLTEYQKLQLINYEHQIINQKQKKTLKPSFKQNNKYREWQLQAKIKILLRKNQFENYPYKVRWIGNRETAYLQAYAYILLIGSLSQEKNIFDFKWSLYNLSRKYLLIDEQKQLIQFLCFIEYSRDPYSFLNKYPCIESIFIKILVKLEEDLTENDQQLKRSVENFKVRRSSITNLNQGQSLSISIRQQKNLQNIFQKYNNFFRFIDIELSDDFSFTFKLYQKTRLFLVIEKDCFFMIEVYQQELDQNLHINEARVTKSDFVEQVTQENEKTGQSKRQQEQRDNFNREQFEEIFLHNQFPKVQQSRVRQIDEGFEIRIHEIDRQNPNRKQPETAQYSIINDLVKVVKNDSMMKKIKEKQLEKKEIMIKRETLKIDIQFIKSELETVKNKVVSNIKKMENFQKVQQTTKREQFNTNKQPQKEEAKVITNIVKQSILRKHSKVINNPYCKKASNNSFTAIKNIPITTPQQKVRITSTFNPLYKTLTKNQLNRVKSQPEQLNRQNTTNPNIELLNYMAQNNTSFDTDNGKYKQNNSFTQETLENTNCNKSFQNNFSFNVNINIQEDKKKDFNKTFGKDQITKLLNHNHFQNTSFGSNKLK